ncbi:unnamed protein product (macronuclear) [Paramecium tetraurelia]|uniref:Uncharacterized protein n=1 Tax=Paramecium tetraurelia TaxID=5888 RepID=A0CXQ7_PARTE|nr:uncharacterized protein GSPATT00011206001 [Paramecium tetraurelia]CAK75574.1 unnamed protein product [Paramecium tetraurelia]|eukprot:XP_001442971.1 hypothetical protein (macronuclear) [Paramecium tetraurelia strain d4-2]
MNYSNYSEKHKRSISPILEKTSEGSKMIHHNRGNYIRHLESQLERAATIDYEGCEQRMRGIEQLIEVMMRVEDLIKL